jgi:4-aminobutyrate aminotransferase-like enzyme
MDFHGNNVHQVGFRNRRVIEAFQAQMEVLPFCTRRYTNIPAIQLAKKLAELAPGDLNRVLLAPGGTTAIGIALKLARAPAATLGESCRSSIHRAGHSATALRRSSELPMARSLTGCSSATMARPPKSNLVTPFGSIPVRFVFSDMRIAPTPEPTRKRCASPGLAPSGHFSISVQAVGSRGSFRSYLRGWTLLESVV